MNKKDLNVTSNEDLKNKNPDVEIFGDDPWKLLCKASCKEQNWMKSTKAMEIEGVGCLVQTTTELDNNISDSTTFIHGVRIIEIKNEKLDVIGRELINDCRIYVRQ